MPTPPNEFEQTMAGELVDAKQLAALPGQQEVENLVVLEECNEEQRRCPDANSVSKALDTSNGGDSSKSTFAEELIGYCIGGGVLGLVLIVIALLLGASWSSALGLGVAVPFVLVLVGCWQALKVEATKEEQQSESGGAVRGANARTAVTVGSVLGSILLAVAFATKNTWKTTPKPLSAQSLAMPDYRTRLSKTDQSKTRSTPEISLSKTFGDLRKAFQPKQPPAADPAQPKQPPVADPGNALIKAAIELRDAIDAAKILEDQNADAADRRRAYMMIVVRIDSYLKLSQGLVAQMPENDTKNLLLRNQRDLQQARRELLEKCQRLAS